MDTAHQFGKKIAIHSYGPEGARDAVRAGADSVEHATDMDDATIAEMVKRGTYYVPRSITIATISIMETRLGTRRDIRSGWRRSFSEIWRPRGRHFMRE